MSTASQLGIKRTNGVPNLLDYILPPMAETRSLPRNYMERLLLEPPPTAVANSISTACQMLGGLFLPRTLC